MCGICGKYNFNIGSLIDQALIKKMTSIIQHRGPDDAGFFIDNNIGLGIRRLSIIDIETGQQPMYNEDGSIVIVFNGEIYNYHNLKKDLINNGHIFSSNCDTEVILHLYEEKGINCLEKLNGMFAFAIWDKQHKKLFIARDRLGIKPLFYYRNSTSLWFASEIKSILQDSVVPKKPDLNGLNDFLSYNYVPTPNTLFKNIYKLPPASYMECQYNKITTKKYWNINYQNEFDISNKNYIEEFYEILNNSVKNRLISDVPLGIFLSGGLDSSSILELASKYSNNPIKTYSITFQERLYDERKYSRTVSNHFKSDHREILLKADLCNILEEIVWHNEGLVANTTTIPLYYLSKYASQDIKVALSGLGSDEILCGYDTYIADILYGYYQKVPQVLRTLIQKYIPMFLPVPDSVNNPIFKLRYFFDSIDKTKNRTHYRWRQIFSMQEKQLLYKKNLFNNTPLQDSYYIYEKYLNHPGIKSDINRFLYADTKVWLTDSELSITDMTGMSQSLEIRVPFLDHKLVEFLAAIPVNLKINRLQKKYILKKAMQNKLPKSIINRPKRGFSVPFRHWLKNDLKEMTLDILHKDRINRMGYFNSSYIDKLLNDHFKQKTDNSRKIFGLLNYFLWHKTFIECE